VIACFEKIKGKETVTFLYSSKELVNNHAHFLKGYFEEFER